MLASSRSGILKCQQRLLLCLSCLVLVSPCPVDIFTISKASRLAHFTKVHTDHGLSILHSAAKRVQSICNIALLHALLPHPFLPQYSFYCSWIGESRFIVHFPIVLEAFPVGEAPPWPWLVRLHLLKSWIPVSWTSCVVQSHCRRVFDVVSLFLQLLWLCVHFFFEFFIGILSSPGSRMTAHLYFWSPYPSTNAFL